MSSGVKRELADEVGSTSRPRVPTHVTRISVPNSSSYAKFGGSLVRYLEAIGLLGPRLTMAHCVWLLQEEIERIAASGAHVDRKSVV